MRSVDSDAGDVYCYLEGIQGHQDSVRRLYAAASLVTQHANIKSNILEATTSVTAKEAQLKDRHKEQNNAR